MIGNNACGSRALGYGRTVRQRRRRSTCVTGGGERLRLGRRRRRSGGARRLARRWSTATSAHDPHRVRPVRPPGLRLLAGAPAARARPSTSTGSWSAPRAPSALVARRHRPAGRATPPHRRWSCSATPSMAEAADAVPALLPHRARSPARGSTPGSSTWCATRAAAAVPDLPRGAGWLFVEVTGDDRRRGRGAGRGVVADAGALGHPAWSPTRPRRPRSGGSARTAPGWPPAACDDARRTPAGRTPRSRRSGSAPTCATSTRCCAEHGLDGVPYGHFGDGCVHVRIDFPFGTGDGGRAAFRAFLEDAARPGRARTAARCPASTATAGPAASCCR